METNITFHTCPVKKNSGQRAEGVVLDTREHVRPAGADFDTRYRRYIHTAGPHSQPRGRGADCQPSYGVHRRVGKQAFRPTQKGEHHLGCANERRVVVARLCAISGRASLRLYDTVK